MVNLIVDVSRYLMILLIADSFSGIRDSVAKNGR